MDPAHFLCTHTCALLFIVRLAHDLMHLRHACSVLSGNAAQCCTGDPSTNFGSPTSVCHSQCDHVNSLFHHPRTWASTWASASAPVCGLHVSLSWCECVSACECVGLRGSSDPNRRARNRAPSRASESPRRVEFVHWCGVASRVNRGAARAQNEAPSWAPGSVVRGVFVYGFGCERLLGREAGSCRSNTAVAGGDCEWPL